MSIHAFTHLWLASPPIQLPQAPGHFPTQIQMCGLHPSRCGLDLYVCLDVEASEHSEVSTLTHHPLCDRFSLTWGLNTGGHWAPEEHSHACSLVCFLGMGLRQAFYLTSPTYRSEKVLDLCVLPACMSAPHEAWSERIIPLGHELHMAVSHVDTRY